MNICMHMCMRIYIYRFCLVCLQDFELIRIWDSLVFEDDCEDELSLSLQATGELDENQTRKVLYLVCSQVDINLSRSVYIYIDIIIHSTHYIYILYFYGTMLSPFKQPLQPNHTAL